ncbi:MAG: hypothetical protein JO359_15270, partial [Candidatus Eremiobacteraeota bacterium]|nr:hypothetical protein [Candidatus Eremiobacteraeota bacterium]
MTLASAQAPRVHTTVVADRREPYPGIAIVGVHAPALVAAVRPGQFVMAVPPTGVLAATALGVYEAQGQRASIMVVSAGPRTSELASLET